MPATNALVRRSCCRRWPLPRGGLYRRSVPTWLEAHWAVARKRALVAILLMCERLVSNRYSSGASPPRSPSAAALAYSSALVAGGPVVCGSQLVVNSLSLLKMREQAFTVATA